MVSMIGNYERELTPKEARSEKSIERVAKELRLSIERNGMTIIGELTRRGMTIGYPVRYD